MAPVFARQSHNPTPAVPRPSKGAPTIPLPGTKYISLKVLLQLFAGTICIFFLAVLFWRLGRFFRRFTKDRVLGGGNITASRYAKTWYGWIPLQQHELHKARVRRCFRWIRNWASWESSKDDYRWVWWDPGQKETKSRRKKEGQLRLLPAWLEDYEGIAADTIWGPCPRIPSHVNQTGPCLPPTMSGALPSRETTRVTARGSYSVSRWRHGENAPTIHEESIILETDGITLEIDARKVLSGSTTRKSRRPVDETPASHTSRRFLSLDQAPQFLRSNRPVALLSDYEKSLRYWQSLPCLLTPELVLQKMQEWSQVSRNSGDISHPQAIHDTSAFFRCSRKYQIWSARMQLKPAAELGYGMGSFPVPPGSPCSEMLRSFSSQQTFCFDSICRARGTITMSISSGSSEALEAGVGKRHPRERARLMHHQHDGPEDGSWSSVRIFTSPPTSRQSTAGIPPLNIYERAAKRSGSQALSAPVKKPVQAERQADEKRLQTVRTQKLSENTKKYIAPQVTVPIRCLSDWEIRLIDGLDRRLDWLSDQLSPGRRVFHFAMLANHWLNKKTWIVYDPISRVPIEARRLLGDPRFNVPYPIPDWRPKPKYPQVHRNVVYKPRIDSWRIAMNRNRRNMGLKDFIKAVELYDGSTDDPPDGSVDPACWILRKPPQGFGISKKQADTYYEGGAGWQETFSDWQRVRRGYRIHKAIHEGRVNRNRVKEIGRGIARCPRKIRSEVFSRPPKLDHRSQ